MESKPKTRKKTDSECQERSAKHYTMNIQRIFHNESNFKFRQLENYDEDRELLSPAESESEDLLGLGDIQFINEQRYSDKYSRVICFTMRHVKSRYIWTRKLNLNAKQNFKHLRCVKLQQIEF